MLCWSNRQELDQTRKQLVMNQVTINLNMIGSFMEVRISCNVESRFIVTEHQSRLMNNTKVMRQICEPLNFTSYNSKGTIFSFKRTSQDCGLLLRFPLYKWWTKINRKIGNEFPSINTSSPIRIAKGFELKLTGRRKENTQTRSNFNVSKNTIKSRVMSSSRKSNELTQVLNDKGDIKSSICKVY